MNKNDIETQIKQVMAAVFSLQLDAIDQTSNNENVSKWDSISHMNLVVALEDSFNLEFLDKEISALTSYPKILESICLKMNI